MNHPICQTKMSANVHYVPIHQTYCSPNIPCIQYISITRMNYPAKNVNSVTLWRLQNQETQLDYIKVRFLLQSKVKMKVWNHINFERMCDSI